MNRNLGFHSIQLMFSDSTDLVYVMPFKAFMRETPKNAIDCFINTNIDYLYFVQEQLLVSKKN